MEPPLDLPQIILWDNHEWHFVYYVYMCKSMFINFLTD